MGRLSRYFILSVACDTMYNILTFENIVGGRGGGAVGEYHDAPRLDFPIRAVG